MQPAKVGCGWLDRSCVSSNCPSTRHANPFPRIVTIRMSAPLPMKFVRLTVVTFLLSPLVAAWPLRSASAQDPPSPAEIQQALATRLPENPAALVAMVGQSPILQGELLPKVDRRIAEVTATQQQQLSDTEIQYARVRLFRNLLQQTIQTKMLREAFLLKQVGTQLAEKRDEAEKMMQSRATALFYEKQVPELKKKLKVETLPEVEAKLRESGTSIAVQKREFIDMMLGQMYLNEMVEREPDVSLLEISQYYQQHRKDYERPARARWEQMSVLFEKTPDRERAWELIGQMGNEAYFGGNLQAVAKAKSQEPFASSGGLHDWTNRGSLASETLE